MAIDVTVSRVVGTTLGVVSAIFSGVNFPCSPTIANGVKLAIDVALLPAGPIADVIGGFRKVQAMKTHLQTQYKILLMII